MASYYVWSGATGAANGTSWANAYVAIGDATTGKPAGDVFYVAHDHAQSHSINTGFTVANTFATPSKVICVNRAGSVPPVSADRRATATVTGTGASQVGIGGCVHVDGIIFTGANYIAPCNATGNSQRFDNCSFRITGAAAVTINFGNGGTVQGAYLELNNTTVSFGAVGQTFDVVGHLRWRNTPSALLGTIPTTLFKFFSGRGSDIECIGVDLSAAGSGKSIFPTNSNLTAIKCRLIDCKLNAAVTIAAVPGNPGSNEVDVVRSGATGVSYNVYRHRTQGLLTEETSIVRTGGALA